MCATDTVACGIHRHGAPGGSVLIRVVPVRSRTAEGSPGMGDGIGGVYYDGVPYKRSALAYLQRVYR